MNNNETSANKQYFVDALKEKLSRDLRQAIKVINADYQQIDWEDSAFLNCVPTDALTFIENQKVIYAGS